MKMTNGTNSKTCGAVKMTTQFDEKEMLTDLLSSQKFVTEGYNTFLNECETESLKNCFTNILNDEHNIQNGLFNDMSSRGWYATTKAPEQKIIAAKNKFSGGISK